MILKIIFNYGAACFGRHPGKGKDFDCGNGVKEFATFISRRKGDFII